MLLDADSYRNHTQDLQRAVRLCYEYSYLTSRLEAGLRLSAREHSRLSVLRRLLELRGERRRHRRLPVAIPVELKTRAGLRRGTLLNVSGAGMFVVADAVLAPGEAVQVRVGGQVEYSFPCQVQWVAGGRSTAGLGLRINGIPLEMRRGNAVSLAG